MWTDIQEIDQIGDYTIRLTSIHVKELYLPTNVIEQYFLKMEKLRKEAKCTQAF